MEKLSCEIRVPWRYGIHIRPASGIVKLLQQFSASVVFFKDGASCNAKSPLQLLTLEAAYGESLTVFAEGAEAAEALHALQIFFERNVAEEQMDPY